VRSIDARWVAGPDGAVTTEPVLAALGCPSAWPFLGDGADAVLGRITARIEIAVDTAA
jgi:hypothetical protein